jgi:hypothetical protein
VPPFAEWENFYVIVGSSAAALIGLQFVVIALISDLRVPSNARQIDAFATPTIVHFGAVLLLSGIMTAPWRSRGTPAAVFAVCGATGLVYSVVVALRAKRQTDYEMVFEDWFFHVVLPAAAYALLAGAASVLRSHVEGALFAVGAVAFLLLSIGIHNAWDTVTYIVVARREQRQAEGDGSDPGAPLKTKP